MRQYIRHPSHIPIEYSIEAVVSDRKDYLNNISCGGLCFKSKVNNENGALINIQIPLVSPIFRATGRVIWANKINGEFEIGVEFLDKKTIFQARMVEQVCHIEKYKKELEEQKKRPVMCEEAALEWIKKYAKDFPAQ